MPPLYGIDWRVWRAAEECLELLRDFLFCDKSTGITEALWQCCKEMQSFPLVSIFTAQQSFLGRRCCSPAVLL